MYSYVIFYISQRLKACARSRELFCIYWWVQDFVHQYQAHDESISKSAAEVDLPSHHLDIAYQEMVRKYIAGGGEIARAH